MRLPWRRRESELDVRDRQARQEAELSRRRQQETREKVIRPLELYAEHNQFAELIRASLIEGRRRRT